MELEQEVATAPASHRLHQIVEELDPMPIQKVELLLEEVSARQQALEKAIGVQRSEAISDRALTCLRDMRLPGPERGRMELEYRSLLAIEGDLRDVAMVAFHCRLEHRRISGRAA